MSSRDIVRTWQTVRHLRPSQLLWRVKRRLSPAPRIPRKSGEPARESAEFPYLDYQYFFEPPSPEFAVGGDQGASDRNGASPKCWVNSALQGKLWLLGQTYSMEDVWGDWAWHRQDSDRLGTITLHYHHWLWYLLTHADDSCLDESEALVARCLEDWLNCSQRWGPDRTLAWNSYAIATRLIAWSGIWRRMFQGGANRRLDASLSQRFLESFHAQARFLSGNFEWDLRANHLLRDCVGLLCAARFLGPACRDHSKWVRQAETVARHQIREQVLEDGGHFERSPAYHLQVMRDMAALIHWSDSRALRDELKQRWREMAEYALWMQHADGSMPQWNDGHQVSPLDELSRQAMDWGWGAFAPRRQGTRWFAETGHLAIHEPGWDVLWDLGPIGAECQPGHGHADHLHLDLSFQGKPLFVDRGTSHYDLDGLRDLDRSTLAHNTVSFGQRNSSDVWHIFRVARRARTRIVSSSIEPLAFSAEHDGYGRLRGQARHRRTILWANQDVGPASGLVIRDELLGRNGERISGGFNLAEGWSVEQTANDTFQLACGERRLSLQLFCEKPISASCVPFTRYPHFHHPRSGLRLQWLGQFDGPGVVETRLTAWSHSPTNQATPIQDEADAYSRSSG